VDWSSDIVTVDHGGCKKCKVLVGNYVGEIIQQVGRFRLNWKCNIKMNLRAVVKDVVGWTFWFRIRVIGGRLERW